jgi:hypothetical protein
MMLNPPAQARFAGELTLNMRDECFTGCAAEHARGISRLDNSCGASALHPCPNSESRGLER